MHEVIWWTSKRLDKKVGREVGRALKSKSGKIHTDDPTVRKYITMYRLCREFGWTLDEVKNMDYDTAVMFLEILNVEDHYERQEQRKLERESKKVRR